MYPPCFFVLIFFINIYNLIGAFFFKLFFIFKLTFNLKIWIFLWQVLNALCPIFFCLKLKLSGLEAVDQTCQQYDIPSISNRQSVNYAMLNPHPCIMVSVHSTALQHRIFFWLSIEWILARLELCGRSVVWGQRVEESIFFFNGCHLTHFKHGQLQCSQEVGSTMADEVMALV